MLPITKESINKVLEKVVFVEANVNGKSPEEVYVRDDDILLYLIMNDGNVLKATKDILDEDKAYPNPAKVLLKLYSRLIYANERISKLESYLMDRDNFEDTNNTDDEEVKE